MESNWLGKGAASTPQIDSHLKNDAPMAQRRETKGEDGQTRPMPMLRKDG